MYGSHSETTILFPETKHIKTILHIIKRISSYDKRGDWSVFTSLSTFSFDFLAFPLFSQLILLRCRGADFMIWTKIHSRHIFINDAGRQILKSTNTFLNECYRFLTQIGFVLLSNFQPKMPGFNQLLGSLSRFVELFDSTDFQGIARLDTANSPIRTSHTIEHVNQF